MQELMNFSVYACDIERFGESWDDVRTFLSHHELDGIELLLGRGPLPDVPAGLVKGVHLPSPVGMYRVLKGTTSFPEEMDEDMILFLYGGRNYQEVQDMYHRSLENASVLDASYAVCHVCYVEPFQVFTRKHGCSDEDVIDVTAQFLNHLVSSFPGGEPPVRIFFENLWWPGLTFLDTDLIYRFMERLEFSNWAFLLDTGHLMNATMSCDRERDGIDKVLAILDTLPVDVIERIEGMHLHYSLSGTFQREALEQGDPAGFGDLLFFDRYIKVLEHVGKIDQHMPFGDSRCSEIVERVSPRFLTHEFVTRSLDEFDAALDKQIGALHGSR
ncbi:MAG: TIM barrel protein [Euryarchaeota archaeon]|nr:TIM barrel protein [Euryarchaeota archaeon]